MNTIHNFWKICTTGKITYKVGQFEQLDPAEFTTFHRPVDALETPETWYKELYRQLKSCSRLLYPLQDELLCTAEVPRNFPTETAVHKRVIARAMCSRAPRAGWS